MKNKISGKLPFVSILLAVSLIGVSLVFAQGSSYLPPPPPPPPPASSYSLPQTTSSIPPPPPSPTGYQQTTFSPPLPPIPDELKKFPLELDLDDFHERNLYPSEKCYFPVKGRKKDFIEFDPQQGGRYVFAKSGLCTIEDDKCYRATGFGRPPFLKPNDPPIITASEESRYRNYPVIPYEYVDDIDFSKCAPGPKGYVNLPSDKMFTYTPQRDYSKQSCYHNIRNTFEQKRVFCDAKQCTFPNNEYCEHKTGKCYKHDYPLKDKKGKSVTTFEDFISINWDWCLDETGAIVPPAGEKPYEDRFASGCSYRITAANFHDTQYGAKPDFLIKCDDSRCMIPYNGEFDLKEKTYSARFQYGRKNLGKTPYLSEFLEIDWICVDPQKVRDFDKTHLCSLHAVSGENSECQLCYQNKKFVYKNCRYSYDELGRRADIPRNIHEYEFDTESKRFYEIIEKLRASQELSENLYQWLLTIHNRINAQAGNSTFDERDWQMSAYFFSQFVNQLEQEITESRIKKAIAKLKQQISLELPKELQKAIDEKLH